MKHINSQGVNWGFMGAVKQPLPNRIVNTSSHLCSCKQKSICSFLFMSRFFPFTMFFGLLVALFCSNTPALTWQCCFLFPFFQCYLCTARHNSKLLPISKQKIKFFPSFREVKPLKYYIKDRTNLNQDWKISKETRVDLLQFKCSIFINSASFCLSPIQHIRQNIRHFNPSPAPSIQTYTFKGSLSIYVGTNCNKCPP